MGPDLDVDEDDDWPGAVRAQIEADVRRVAERLRTLSEAQLAAEAPPHASRAAGGRAVAQVLADAAQAIEERASGTQPHRRAVPVGSDFAVGDQVAVTGHDLLAALAHPAHPAHLPPSPPGDVPPSPPGDVPPSPPGDHAVPAVGPEETVWADGARRTAEEVVADAAAQLAALRRLL